MLQSLICFVLIKLSCLLLLFSVSGASTIFRIAIWSETLTRFCLRKRLECLLTNWRLKKVCNTEPFSQSVVAVDLNKDTIFIHSKGLRYSLNNDTTKVCLKKEQLPEEFKLIKIDNYLQKYIGEDPHFFFSKEDNEIKATMDWGNFFSWKGNHSKIKHLHFFQLW